jgi:hypothetical protein
LKAQAKADKLAGTMLSIRARTVRHARDSQPALEACKLTRGDAKHLTSWNWRHDESSWWLTRARPTKRPDHWLEVDAGDR